MSAALTRTKWKWFWAWDAPKEEKWLEQMAHEGWHLARGGIVFTFVKGAPADCRYRLDYRTETLGNLREYIALCNDAGWEHVCRFAGWHYFRTADAAAPELHTDPSSLADRYKRLLALLIILLLLNASLMLGHVGRQPVGRFTEFYAAMEAVRVAIIVLLGYAIYRIGVFIRKLKGDSGRAAI